MSEFRFCSISLERVDIIYQNILYALILNRSRLEWLLGIFRKFATELWPLIDVRVSLLLKIFTKNGQNFIKFRICVGIDKIWVRIVSRFSANF